MLVKMVQPVKSLLSKAGVEPLLVPYAQQIDERHLSTGHANPLDNLFNPDHRVPQTIITSVTQAIGYFEHKANQSINPLDWIDILFNAPKLLLNYLDFSSPIIEKVLDVAWKVALLYYLIAQIDFPVNLPTF